MTLAEDLSAAILAIPTDPDRLPVAETTLQFVDTMGCHYFGNTLGFPMVLLDLVTVPGAPCSVFGTGRRASVTDAAFANAVLESSFELDSGGAFVHPGPCVIPATLAVAELLATQPAPPTISGVDFIRALAIGYETSVRVAEWVGFVPEKNIGWHTPSFHGAIGAAAAAAALLRLDGERLAHALAVAADMAGGGLIHSRNNAKRFHTARAAQTGVVAALLARQGIRAGLDVLEDPRWGYRRAMTYSGEGPVDIPQPNIADVTDGFGGSWRAWGRLGIKYYPFHSAGQTILDNCRELALDRQVSADDVASVRVGLSSFMHGHSTMLLPATDIGDANFCLPFAAAVGLIHHPARLTEPAGEGVAQIFVDAIGDPAVRELESRVSFEASAQLDDENPYTMDTIVAATLADGTVVSTRTHYGQAARARGGAGSIGFAATDERGIRTKFRNLAAPTLGTRQADILLENLVDCFGYPDIADFLTALRQAAAQPRRPNDPECGEAS